jgi:hypothetical protein
MGSKVGTKGGAMFLSVPNRQVRGQSKSVCHQRAQADKLISYFSFSAAFHLMMAFIILAILSIPHNARSENTEKPAPELKVVEDKERALAILDRASKAVNALGPFKESLEKALHNLKSQIKSSPLECSFRESGGPVKPKEGPGSENTSAVSNDRRISGDSCGMTGAEREITVTQKMEDSKGDLKLSMALTRMYKGHLSSNSVTKNQIKMGSVDDFDTETIIRIVMGQYKDLNIKLLSYESNVSLSVAGDLITVGLTGDVVMDDKDQVLQINSKALTVSDEVTGEKVVIETAGQPEGFGALPNKILIPLTYVMNLWPKTAEITGIQLSLKNLKP